MVSTSDRKTRRGNFQPKKDKNLPQILVQSYLRKVKRKLCEGSLLRSYFTPKKKKYGQKRRRDDTSTSGDLSSSDGNNSDDSQHARFKIVTGK